MKKLMMSACVIFLLACTGAELENKNLKRTERYGEKRRCKGQ